MAKTKNTVGSDRVFPPATTMEEKESQMIALAMELAERQLREGTASSQVITHYLKLGSIREQKEMEMLHLQEELLKAKTEAIQSQQVARELYEDALKAFRKYQGDNES